MANKQSAAMTKAQKLIEEGMSAPDAAAKAKVALNGIYRKPWWKALQATKTEVKV